MKRNSKSEKSDSVKNSPFIDLTYDYGFKIVMADPDHTAFRDRLMVYSGDPLMHLLRKRESYSEVRTLYIVSVLGSYLRVNDEPKDFHDRLLRRASVTMNERGFALSDKPILFPDRSCRSR